MASITSKVEPSVITAQEMAIKFLDQAKTVAPVPKRKLSQSHLSVLDLPHVLTEF